MTNQKIIYILSVVLFLSLAFGCQSPSSTNDKEDENQNLPGLTQNFSYNTEVGNYKTRVFDGINVSDGIVVVGSYLENSSGVR